MIRTVAASAAALALAACGGHGIVPSQSAAPMSLVRPEAANPCYTAAVQPAWIFKGSCDVTKLASKGATIKLAAYKGITESTVLPANNGNGSAFVLVDAVGGKDIAAYKGAKFPALPKSIGKSVLYVEVVNGFNGLKFTAKNLVFSVTATQLPSKTCALSVLKPAAKGYSWTKAPLPPKVSGNTITFTIPATAVSIFFPTGLPKGPVYFNTSCT